MRDPEIEEFEREHRMRWILVASAVVGIMAGTTLGVAFSLGAFEAPGAHGVRNPAALIFFIGPFAACMAMGTLVHRIARAVAHRR